MAAPKGNNFYKLRTKIGRELLFASPEALWEAAQEYFNHCDSNPIIVVDWVGKDAIKIERKLKRPYLIQGFAYYLDVSESWWRNFKRAKAIDEGFLTVIARIENRMSDDKISGAAVGIYKENIVSRIEGLADKKDHTIGEKPKPDWMEDAIPNE
jgi:hypothetical protein